VREKLSQELLHTALPAKGPKPLWLGVGEGLGTEWTANMATSYCFVQSADYILVGHGAFDLNPWVRAEGDVETSFAFE